MKTFRFHRTYRSRLQAVIFDWAGCTVDYGSLAPAGVFVEVFRRHGVSITGEEAREPMGTYKRVHLERLLAMPAIARRWESVHGRPSDAADLETMFNEFIPMQIACLPSHADIVPGCLETMASLRSRGIKIGSTTGYDGRMMEVLCDEAKRRGYEPDAMVCMSDVPVGRPAPWMCLENAKRLNVYPMEAIVKVDDTTPGIEEGLNCGMWTIAIAKTGNELGLSEADVAALPAAEYSQRIERAYANLAGAGAHYVVDGIADVPACVEDIERRLTSGERP
jgi:phosphonoacetaldehyde hydrolase